jgi:hypothetical protein
VIGGVSGDGEVQTGRLFGQRVRLVRKSFGIHRVEELRGVE